MKLYFRNTYLGDIDNQFFDQPEVHGLFRARPEAEDFQRFFAWMLSEDSFSEDPPFADELLDESNWFVIDDPGRTRGITIPGVYGDGEIVWRWREEA